MAMKPLRPCLHPGCGVLVSSGYCAAHQPRSKDQRSAEAQAWRWMYGTDVWKRLRENQLLREPFCRERARRGVRRYATDVDHIRDHKGDWALFTDPGNLESLCHSCHSRKTARELWQNRREKRRRRFAANPAKTR